MCFTETYSTVCICKNLSHKFPTQKGLNKERFITIAFQLCLEYAIRRAQEKQEHKG
jgi:hypothetical protein